MAQWKIKFFLFTVAFRIFICASTPSNNYAQGFNPVCVPLLESEKLSLLHEIKEYEKSYRFQEKLDETRGLRAPDPRQGSIAKYLARNALRKNMSILDLGCAAGNLLKLVSKELERLGGQGNLTGIELVPGWVTGGNQALNGTAHIIEGDVTDFKLGSPPPQYDLLMMNDALEHVLTTRYACLFKAISEHTTKPGSFVYFHIPAPATQLLDHEQYFENVVPPHVLISGLAAYGYELYNFEQDTGTRSRFNFKTIMNGYGTAKYLHILFRKPATKKVFKSSQNQHYNVTTEVKFSNSFNKRTMRRPARSPAGVKDFPG
jgi:SAM-dependent methyltransferase